MSRFNRVLLKLSGEALKGDLAFGYRISPVHAIEIGGIYSNVASKHAFGVDLDCKWCEVVPEIVVWFVISQGETE